MPPQRFAEAVRAEGVACGYQYIEAIFFSARPAPEAHLRHLGVPFSLQDGAHAVRYEPGECPNCEAALDEMLTVPLHESWARPSLGTSRPRLRKSVRTPPAWRTFSSTDELDERTQRTMPRRFHRWTASSVSSAPPPGPVVTRRGLLLLWTEDVASGPCW